ncbi:hypothetical protein RHMOL_Rhmol08G0182400 [Rhododendron molle]|uniref:Uncharacterized protein n=1 Tax=Rhododendron molle TaxID=49168 RepID=A0ACC0MQX6_RHOML|nr:hypothetical protein RHMOL_Rhmol08G0182400 [Rhododendron molle]
MTSEPGEVATEPGDISTELGYRARGVCLQTRVIFFPLWLFHGIVARGRFSLPAPSVPHGRHWAPCHAIVAAPFLIAFELLLCIYLESIAVSGSAAVNLKIVFLPLLAFEIIILIDNFRMCKALLPGDDESVSDEAIWETLPHFWVAISMVFFVAATLFTLLKLCGDVNALGWWDLFINYGIAECFAFLVCTKWSNPVIHMNSRAQEASSSSNAIRYLDWNSGLVVSSDDQSHDRICSLQDIGGHIMKVPIIGFQILLCMRLEGTPAGAKDIPLPVLFSPLFLLQGVGVLFALSRLVEKFVLLLRTGADTGRYFLVSSKVRECFGYLHHGSRLLGWWSIDEGSREEQARLFHDGAYGTCGDLTWYQADTVLSKWRSNAHVFSFAFALHLQFAPLFVWMFAFSVLDEACAFPVLLLARFCELGDLDYNTFCGYPPEIVKKMPKKDLAEEVWRLQAALGEQAEITKFSQQEYERLQNEKVLCRVCFEAEIGVVLLPCRHRILCSGCCDKCKKCPICRVLIEERLPVYDV